MSDSKTFDDFLWDLLVAESGIDPSRFDWYVTHYSAHVMRSARVEVPGRAVRDRSTGALVFETVTVAKYFENLGVAALFDTHDPTCLRRMQYECMNALGFVGYQLGEALLISTGHYRAQQVVHSGLELEAYYVGSVGASAWRDGRRAVPYHLPGTNKIILATDVNRWDGSFSGRDGIWSLDDLKRPNEQERVIRATLRHNYRCIVGLLASSGSSLSDALVRRSATLSSVLAAAHLCGAFAAAAYLINGAGANDETGTSLASYIARFRGYPVSEAVVQ